MESWHIRKTVVGGLEESRLGWGLEKRQSISLTSSREVLYYLSLVKEI